MARRKQVLGHPKAARIQRVEDEKKLAEAQAQLDAKNKEVAELRAELGL